MDGIDRLKRLDDFTLVDLEAVRLILRGESVIDWHRLNFENEEEARQFLRAQELHPEDAADRHAMDLIKQEAIGYLRRHFEFPIPKPIEQASVEELLMVACGRGHRQTCACTILKCMHIIHHLEGRELLFMLPLSDQEVFHMVEEKVYRVIGGMLAHGFPILEFVGGRKNKDSLYTKLLSKHDTIAAQVYDKLRFRIVTRSYDDIFPVIQYLTTHLFPFNYVIPGQSTNSMFQFKSYAKKKARLARLLPDMQSREDDELTPNDNSFSANNYRVVHFVVDLPVRIPTKQLERAEAGVWQLAPVVFVICEFQVIDRETEAKNERGEASHAKYKERQKRAVMRRLQMGSTREPKIALREEREATPPPPKSAPPSRTTPSRRPPPTRR
ncbi:MAG TPA: TIGR04552 family protein [Polyangiaceae bacterium]